MTSHDKQLFGQAQKDAFAIVNHAGVPNYASTFKSIVDAVAEALLKERKYAADIAEQLAVEKQARAEAVSVLEAVADDVCGVLCPSAWMEKDGRPPCHPKCQAIRSAIAPLEAPAEDLITCAADLRALELRREREREVFGPSEIEMPPSKCAYCGRKFAT